MQGTPLSCKATRKIRRATPGRDADRYCEGLRILVVWQKACGVHVFRFPFFDATACAERELTLLWRIFESTFDIGVKLKRFSMAWREEKSEILLKMWTWVV